VAALRADLFRIVIESPVTADLGPSQPVGDGSGALRAV
jgi:hypothetical protein